jgi:hypothetical protein
MKWLLTAILMFAILYFVYDKLFAHYLPESHVWYKVALTSLLMVLPASILFGIVSNLRMYRIISNRYNMIPEDGKWIALTGTVSSGDQILQTPFAQKECVSYHYSISKFDHTSATSKAMGRGEMGWIPIYSGFAVAPWNFRSSVANIQIKALAGGSQYLSANKFNSPDDTVVANARRFVESTTFEKSDNIFTKDALGAVQFADSFARKDWVASNLDPAIDLKDCLIEEKYQPLGTEFLATGIWSSQSQTLSKALFRTGTQKEVLSGIRGQLIVQILMVPFLTAFINFVFYNLFKFSN